MVDDLDAIEIVAIRVVAPGTFFQAHRIIDATWMKALHESADQAPVHIPHTEAEIVHIQQMLPNARCLGISDSALHVSLPARARRYSIPSSDAERYDLYRFGYHGISVGATLRTLPKILNKPASRVIVCHIGSGVSVTAVQDGMSIDTTMGYAPGSGLLMSSRAGDLDAGALLAYMQRKGARPIEAQKYLQQCGGLQGLSGTNDLRQILERDTQGDAVASQALESFVYHIQKAIGGALVALGGLDALVFTATAGERSAILREKIIAPLAQFNLVLDAERNASSVRTDAIISSEGITPVIAVVRTNEAEEMLRITRLML
jgi:acetate kinase